MILLDTNVLIYASTARSPFFEWARQTIAEGVSEGGAAVNTVCLSEVCVGDAEPELVADRLRSWGITLLDIPVAAAEPCASAYFRYRERRRAESGRDSPSIPLPDFFIGAHAMVMGWPIATADEGRFQTYFPAVALRTPLLG
ncbi:MAG: PIN domain-containing protein [Acidobacteriota bacterium]